MSYLFIWISGDYYHNYESWSRCPFRSSESDSSKLTLTKNAINKNGVELTIYAKVVSDITIIVKGR